MKMVLGDRIKSLREKRDMNQTELAKKIGISKSVMSRIEAGTRPLEDSLLVRLTDVLDTSADYLLGIGTKETKEETEMERMKREIREIVNKAKTEEDIKSMLHIVKKALKE